jgi:hypothetical protein
MRRDCDVGRAGSETIWRNRRPPTTRPEQSPPHRTATRPAVRGGADTTYRLPVPAAGRRGLLTLAKPVLAAALVDDLDQETRRIAQIPGAALPLATEIAADVAPIEQLAPFAADWIIVGRLR